MEDGEWWTAKHLKQPEDTSNQAILSEEDIDSSTLVYYRDEQGSLKVIDDPGKPSGTHSAQLSIYNHKDWEHLFSRHRLEFLAGTSARQPSSTIDVRTSAAAAVSRWNRQIDVKASTSSPGPEAPTSPPPPPPPPDAPGPPPPLPQPPSLPGPDDGPCGHFKAPQQEPVTKDRCADACSNSVQAPTSRSQGAGPPSHTPPPPPPPDAPEVPPPMPPPPDLSDSEEGGNLQRPQQQPPAQPDSNLSLAWSRLAQPWYKVVVAPEEDAQQQSPVWRFQVLLQAEAFAALTLDRVAVGGMPGREVELRVVEVLKTEHPDQAAAMQQVQGMCALVQTTDEFIVFCKTGKGFTTDQELWESLLPGPGRSHRDDWYVLKTQGGRGEKQTKRNTYQWNVYLKAGVRSQFIKQLEGTQQVQSCERWLGQVEIYQDCHPGINSALAKQLAYRVAAARYGTVKSYQELCDWWGAQHKPKTPEEVKDWLYKNKDGLPSPHRAAGAQATTRQNQSFNMDQLLHNLNAVAAAVTEEGIARAAEDAAADLRHAERQAAQSSKQQLEKLRERLAGNLARVDVLIDTCDRAQQEHPAPQPRKPTLQQQLDWVVAVLKEYNQHLSARDRLAFNIRRFCTLCLEGKYCLGMGVCQGGKTGIILAVALCAWVSGHPCLLMMCSVKANAQDLHDSLDRQLQLLRRHSPTFNAASPDLTFRGLCPTPKSRINALDPEEVEKFRTGRLALVFNWLESHIQHVADKLLTASCPPAYLAMDEADAFWASFNPDFMIMRELALRKLGGRRQPSGRFPLFSTLAQVTATPLCCILWHMVNKVPLEFENLRQADLEACGYVGISDCTPWQPDGQPEFLEPLDITKDNGYGLGVEDTAPDGPPAQEEEEYSDESDDDDDCDEPEEGRDEEEGVSEDSGPGEAEEDSPDELSGDEGGGDEGESGRVRRFYRWVEQDSADKRYPMALDICNPRVHTPEGIKARAQRLSALHPNWIVMCTASTLGTVVYGDGPEQHFSEKETRRLWRKAGGQWTKREMQCTLQNVVAHYDHPKYKHKVLVLIGYNRMRRAVTVRSKRRVPAYMLLAPSRGQQLSNLIQMMGRVAGRSKARLLKNKYTGQKVTVLMYQNDWLAATCFYEFNHRLAQAVKTWRRGSKLVLPANTADVFQSGRLMAPKRLAVDENLLQHLEFQTSSTEEGSPQSSEHEGGEVTSSSTTSSHGEGDDGAGPSSPPAKRRRTLVDEVLSEEDRHLVLLIMDKADTRAWTKNQLAELHPHVKVAVERNNRACLSTMATKYNWLEEVGEVDGLKAYVLTEAGRGQAATIPHDSRLRAFVDHLVLPST